MRKKHLNPGAGFDEIATIHPSSDVQTTKIGKGTRIWQYVVILPGASIGEDCNICSHCFIENSVSIGNRVTIKSGTQLWDGIHVCDDVFIGPNVTFTNDIHPKSGNRHFNLLETHIAANASIGAGATLLPGIRIGASAVIGAGSVVTKDVKEGAIVAGNPAAILNT